MKLTTQTITRIAILLALAVVLDYVSTFIPFLRMPNGGQASLGYIPLIILALIEGWWPSIIAALAFTFLQWIYTPVYLVHWFQFFLDYPLPVISIVVLPALSLVFKSLNNRFYMAIALTFVGAVIAFWLHVFSGVLFFAEYADESPVWIYSIVYNAGYMIATAAANIVGVSSLFHLSHRLKSIAR